MNIQGQEIKIGRPKAYSGAMSAIGLMANAVTGATPAALLGMKSGTYHSLDDNSTSGISNPLMGGKMADEIVRVQMPSRVLVIRNIVTLRDVKDDQVFSDIYSDIMDRCLLYGKVLEIKIPRPVFVDRSEQNK